MTSIRVLGLEVTRTSGGHEMVCCPFHSDRNASAWFNPKKRLFYCAVCGTGMNINQLARALKIDYEWDGEDFEQDIPDYQMFNSTQEFEIGLMLMHPYIESRGVDEFYANGYGLRVKTGSPEAIVMPMLSLSGKIIGASYRFIDPSKAGTRYKKVGTQTDLWPLPFLLEDNIKRVIVTEGGWSAMALAPHLNRYERAVALMGARANRDIAQLVQPFDEVVFLYDDDIAGDRACRQMRRLSPLRQSFTLEKAPDDMEESEIKTLLEKVRKLNERYPLKA